MDLKLRTIDFKTHENHFIEILGEVSQKSNNILISDWKIISFIKHSRMDMQIYHYTLIKNFHIARKCWYEHDFTKYYTLKRLNITMY